MKLLGKCLGEAIALVLTCGALLGLLLLVAAALDLLGR